MTDIHWTKEEHGIPHKNGHVRFYLVGFDDDVFGYLGWFDMNDWDEGWKKVWETAEAHRFLTTESSKCYATTKC